MSDIKHCNRFLHKYCFIWGRQNNAFFSHFLCSFLTRQQCVHKIWHKKTCIHLMYVALLEVIWCMVVLCTPNLRQDGSSFMWHQPCQRCKYTTLVDIQKRTLKTSRSCRITCDCSESARERKIALYKQSSVSQSTSICHTSLEGLTANIGEKNIGGTIFLFCKIIAKYITFHKKHFGSENSELDFSAPLPGFHAHLLAQSHLLKRCDCFVFYWKSVNVLYYLNKRNFLFDLLCVLILFQNAGSQFCFIPPPPHFRSRFVYPLTTWSVDYWVGLGILVEVMLLFFIFSSLKIADIQQLPEEYKQKSRTNHNQSSSHVTELDIQEAANQKATKLKRTERLHEESAVHGPMYKFSGAKEIPMVDSIWLQRERKKQLQVILCLYYLICECEFYYYYYYS